MTKCLTVLVSGSRYWTTAYHIRIIYRVLSRYPKGTILVHGAAPGVDTIAGNLGKELGFSVRPYPADWTRYGKGAGVIRNSEMLRCEKPDIVLAFHDEIDLSSGTKDMIKKSCAQNVKTMLFMC